MQEVPGLTFAEAGLDFFRRSTWFASSDGAAIDQVVTHSGGGIEAVAVGDGDMQRRSYPNSFRGHVKAAGYEHIRTLGPDRGGRAHRPGSRRAAVGARVPERGHDAGARLRPDGAADPRVDRPPDRARPRARHGGGLRRIVVALPRRRREGALRERPRLDHRRRHASRRARHLRLRRRGRARPARARSSSTASSRTSCRAARRAGVVGQSSNATSRADGWSHLPLIRMTNISIEPREGTLAEIIGDTTDGIFMSTNSSWSIDDKRINFQFGCEHGLAHRRTASSPRSTRTRTTPASRPSSGARATRSAAREDWVVWGTPNCGKGQPGQVGRVGHGASPARFRNVQVGVRG